MENTEDEVQRLASEFVAKLAARPVKATHDLATLGIISSLQSGAQIQEYADENGIPGLRQPGYVAPIETDA